MSSKDRNYNFNLKIPGLFPHMDFFAGMMCTVLFCGSMFSWIYLLAITGENTGVLIMEGVVNLLVLSGNIYMICRIGYNDYWHSFRISYGVETFLTIVGFYICRLHFLVPPAGEVVFLYRFLELLIYVAVAMMLSVLPCLIVSLIVWIIVAIFAKKDKE